MEPIKEQANTINAITGGNKTNNQPKIGNFIN